jgi:AcrR family transcriptional regulator
VAQRLTARDYFVVSLEILGSDGHTALTAAGLCERMGVTRGSFYHHFASFDEFVDRLLEHWEQQYTSDPFALVQSLVGEESQLEEQLLLAQALPHAAEIAIRMWGAVNDRVARAQSRVDGHRRASVADYLHRIGLSAADAEVYADLAVSSLVGMQLLDRPVDAARLRRVLGEVQAQARTKVVTFAENAHGPRS